MLIMDFITKLSNWLGNTRNVAAKAAHTMSPKRRRTWIIVAVAAVAVGVALYFILRKEPAATVMPTVEVEDVTTDNINI